MSTILPGAPPPAAGGPHPDAPVKFNGNGREFVGMCVRGALLELVTFGFYRFWLATDLRRHLWSHTQVGGEPLEYTGRARELLIGFLIALAIIVPIQLSYFLIGIEVERMRAFASVPLALFFVLFGQFALYRARRYRLTRTIWRGVRFWMTGSGWKYAFRWLGWALVSLLTLGIAYPWMRTSLERYKMTNTYYGDLKGEFTGSAKAFFKRGFLIWLVCVIPFLLLIAAGVAESPLLRASGGQGAGVVLGVLGGLWMIAVPFIWPFFRALEWRWWAQGVRFSGLSLTSDIAGGELLRIYVKLFFVALLVALGTGVVLAVFAAILALTLGMPTNFNPEKLGSLARGIPVIAGILISYLIVFLAVGVVQRFYLTREMWRVIATSLTVAHLEAADGVAARGEAVNALGEGLADGLDIAGF